MGTLLTCSLLGPLASACVYDLRERRIPNKLVVGMMALWCLICAGWLVASGGAVDARRFMVQGFIGALCLGGGSLVLAHVFERISGHLSFGGGDVKLLFVIGLYLGVMGGVSCSLVACIAAMVMAFVVPRTRFANVPGSVPGCIPFAPALFVGALLCVL